jgi:hypothetical protein
VERFIRENLNEECTTEHLTVPDLIKFRKRKVTIAYALLNIADEESKEVYLLREFVISCLSKFHQTLIRNLLVGYFDRQLYLLNVNFDYRRYNTLWILPALLIAYYTFGCMIVIVWGAEIYVSAPNIFLIVFLSAYFGDLLLVVPTKLLVQFLIIDTLTYHKLELLRRFVTLRARHILRRNSGFFMYRYWNVQHVNPAVRTAREFPKLSVSRLLMCVNDFDIPRAVKKWNIIDFIRLILDVCCFCLTFPFTMILEDIGVVAFEIVAVVSLGALTYLCDYFDVLPVAPAIFSIPLLILFFSYLIKNFPNINYLTVFDENTDESDVNEMQRVVSLENDICHVGDEKVINDSVSQESFSSALKSVHTSPDGGSSVSMLTETFQTIPNRNVVLPPIDLSALYQRKAKQKPVFAENDSRRSRGSIQESIHSSYRLKPRRENLFHKSDSSNDDNEKVAVKVDEFSLIKQDDIEEFHLPTSTGIVDDVLNFEMSKNLKQGDGYKTDDNEQAYYSRPHGGERHDGQGRDYGSGSDHDRERRRHHRRHRSRRRRRLHHESRGLRNDHRHHGDNYGSRRSEHYQKSHGYVDDSRGSRHDGSHNKREEAHNFVHFHNSNAHSHRLRHMTFFGPRIIDDTQEHIESGREDRRNELGSIIEDFKGIQITIFLKIAFQFF